MRLRDRISTENTREQVIVEAQVVPDSSRCVQCGICSYYCPIGIDVRRHAWLDIPIIDSRCLTCGECIARCPRAVLRFDRTPVFSKLRDVSKNRIANPLAGAGQHD